MLDDQVAQQVTISSVRETGNLFPAASNPVGLDMTLNDARIKDEPRVEELKVRIIQKLQNHTPVAYKINKDAFRDVDPDTGVGDVVAIVTTADPDPVAGS